jgi:O-antigen/teichoic acid export membrane protein
MGSAAISRMPDPILSLAVWPVVSGLIFMLRSLGVAYNEVVVALLDEPRSYQSLRRYALYLILLTTSILLIFAATPLSSVWFHSVSGLDLALTQIAIIGLWISLPMPALSVLQSWFQGIILHSRNTRIITEAVVIFLFTSIILLIMGVIWGEVLGLYIGLAVFVIANLTQTLWLWWRSAKSQKQIQEAELLQQTTLLIETSLD